MNKKGNAYTLYEQYYISCKESSKDHNGNKRFNSFLPTVYYFVYYLWYYLDFHIFNACFTMLLHITEEKSI